MPNRIIKESIHSSEKVNQMTDFQFRLWVSLITYVDDYGRGDARPAIIKGTCFPLKDRLTNKDVEAALKALSEIGSIRLYESGGKPYLCFPNWGKHQSIRNKKSKFPVPSGVQMEIDDNPQTLESGCEQLQAVDFNCNQMQADESKCARNPIQSNPNPNILCAEPSTTPHAPSAAPVFQVILNDKTFFDVTADMIARWKELYPAVNVEQSMRDIVGWCEANPKQRKTRNGAMRFLNAWMAREQNKGGKGYQNRANGGYNGNQGGYDWRNDPAYQGVINHKAGR